MKRWINGHRLVLESTRVGVESAKLKKLPNSPIFVLEEDNLERAFPPESDEEAYARNERVMLAAAAEVERLKPIVGAKVGCEPARPVEDEHRQMRAVIEAMRPIVEAAMRFVDPVPAAEPVVTNLVSMTRTNRDRLTAAMAAWEGGKATVDRLLTIEEYDSLVRLQLAVASRVESSEWDPSVFSAGLSAISKLFAASGGRGA